MELPVQSEPSPAVEPPMGPAKSSFGLLARKITTVTSNFLAIALVLLLGLTLGREVIGWWRAEEEMNLQPANVANETTHESLAIGVGERATPLELRTTSGDRDSAVATLVDMGNSAAAAIDFALPPSTREEQQFVESLRSTPALVTTANAALYEMPGTVPMVVAVRGERIVFCGVGLATSPRRWSLYGLPLHASDAAAADQAIPLPPGAQRVMSLANPKSGSTLVFAGSGPIDSWLKHYEQWFLAERWVAVRRWQLVGDAWQASYEQHASPAARVELQLCPDREQRWTGLITLTISPTSSTE